MRNILFQSSDCNYEEGSSIIIWEQDGKYIIREFGHCVYSGDYDNRRQITSDEAIIIMLENIDNEDTDYLEMF